MSLVVGVDSSTQSCKVELRALERGRLLASATAPHPPAHAPCSEQWPADWWTALRRSLDTAIATAGVRRDDIAAISVAAQCHGLVALDVDDAVIRPAKLWNDTTTAPELERLRTEIGASAWVDAVGSLPTSAFTLSKLLWLARHEPRSYARMTRVCQPHDWLTLRLCGRHVTDRSEASGTGYWSAAQNRYLHEYLALVDSERDWTPVLPEVLRPDQAAGELRADAARELGLPSGIVVGPGGGDQQAAALGLAVEPGDTVYTVATSGVVFTTAAQPVFDHAGMIDGVADCCGGYLPLVSTLNAARVTDWLARMLRVDHDELACLALAADPVHSPVFAAFLDGERKPNRPDASGLLVGLTSATGREELARAAFEGVLLGLLRGEACMRAAGIELSGQLLLTGGGARSVAYRQLLADLTGREVAIADPADAGQATARGAAVQAAATLTHTDLHEQSQAWAPHVSVVAAPRPGTSEMREQLLARYLTVADRATFDAPRRG